MDIAAKSESIRAEVDVFMHLATLQMVTADPSHKGDVFTGAHITGIETTKRIWGLTPLCHPLIISSVEVRLTVETEPSCVHIESCCHLTGKRGIKM